MRDEYDFSKAESPLYRYPAIRAFLGSGALPEIDALRKDIAELVSARETDIHERRKRDYAKGWDMLHKAMVTLVEDDDLKGIGIFQLDLMKNIEEALDTGATGINIGIEAEDIVDIEVDLVKCEEHHWLPPTARGEQVWTCERCGAESRRNPHANPE